MHVFIDTNVFLSFYHLTSENLKKLEELIHIIEKKSIILQLPEQVKDETWRNRSTKIDDKFKELKKEKFTLNLPAYCKDYTDYQLLKDCLADCKTHHSNMVKKIESDISSQQLKADKLINDIFNKVKCINRTPEIISRARDRWDIGNPPGKDNSLGDAINWESLLHSVPKNKEIHIISGDRDFHSPLDKTKLNEFLFNEWKEEKNCEPQFFNTLSSFFNRYFPDINLADEKEKVQLIESLSASPNFRLTHIYIEELAKYNSFTSSQATGLFDALINNDQINRIIIDDDIKKFYDELYQKHKTNLSDYRDKIENLLSDDSK